MSDLYLIRNLLSLKVAKSIVHESLKDSPVFAIINNMPQLKKEILNNINDNKCHVEDMIGVAILPIGVNVLKQRSEVENSKELIKDQIIRNDIKRVFITYPLHFEAYLYYSVAKSLGVEVAYFEEGPCFYRGDYTKQYAINDLRSLIRNIYFNICGLKRGYVLKPDLWFSSMPISGPHSRVKLIYNKVNLPEKITRLFLSRPISSDYANISIEDEVNAIQKFSESTCSNGDKIYIKFHPREDRQKRREIKEKLTSLGINILSLDVIQSSEDVLFSMDAGAMICGYDTTTLVYSKSINNEIETFSVLGMIADKDPSGFLVECYNEYKALYPHITMLD